jgi:hypothetical protein
MPFAGSKISAPAMAAAQGMRDVTLNRVTDKAIRPLTETGASASRDPVAGADRSVAGQAAGPTASLGKDLAGQAGAIAGPASPVSGAAEKAAGSSSLPLSALTELAPGTMPMPPDFLDIPKLDPLAILAPARQQFQALAANRPRAPQGAAAGALAALAGGAGPAEPPGNARGGPAAQTAEQAAGALRTAEAGGGKDDPRPARPPAGMPVEDATIAPGRLAPPRRIPRTVRE